MKRKLSLVLGILLLAVSLVVAGCGGQEGNTDNGNDSQAAKNETIKIGKVPYPHEWIPASIIKNVAEELGYSTEMVDGDIGFMFLGLSQGDIDVYPDVWLPTLHKTYVDKYKDKMELTGTLYEEIDMGWAVPSYVDVDSIEDLKGRADEFDGKIIGIEPSSGIMLTTEQTIEAYGLDNYELLVGSTPAMLAEVEKATKNEEPVVFLAWRPHTMFTKYDIKVLKDPKGIWSLDDAVTGVSTDLKDKAPEVYEFTKNFKISIDEIESMLTEMETSDKEADELAKEWIKNNRDQIDEWLGK